MSTPNTPAPGTPEWLRAMSDCNARCDRDEDAQGLRAAAERIEELEESRDDSREDAQGYRDDLLRMKASLARLRAENEALRITCDAKQEACNEFGRIVEGLRADKERLEWLLEHGAVGYFSQWREADGGKERTLFQLHSRADIDAARRWGA